MRNTKLKDEILELIKSTESPVYFSDLAEALGADLKAVVQACKKLLDEGEIAVCRNRPEVK